MTNFKSFVGKVFVLLIKILIPLAIIAGIFFYWRMSKEGPVEVTAKSSLEKIQEISQLSTLEYMYNSRVTVKDPEGNDKYHVAYEGLVNIGVDFDKIAFLVNDDKKTLDIVVPQPKVQDVSVDAGSLDYIFEKEEYARNPVLSNEALKAATADLRVKANDPELMKIARENAETTLRALYEPWVKEAHSDFKVIVR